MKAGRATLLIFLCLLLMVSALHATSQSNGIIVNNADEVRDESFSVTRTLLDLIAEVGPRTVLQYANELRCVDLAPVPGTLQALLDQVPDRIVLLYANHNREYELVYPVDLIGDSTPPQISSVGARPMGAGKALISWTTDEHSDSEAMYGEQSGSYTDTVSNSLYVKEHEVTLIGLAPETTYFYQVQSTDRSGNTATSAEYSFTAVRPTYLPLVLRRSS